MPFVRILLPQNPASAPQPFNPDLSELHALLLEQFGVPQHILRIVASSGAAFPNPAVPVIDIRAQRRPTRTPEMLAGVVAAIDVHLATRGQATIGSSTAIVRMELCSPEDVTDNYC